MINIYELLAKYNILPVSIKETPEKDRQLIYKCWSGNHSDKNPSMSVNNDKGLYNCFACGYKGNIYTLAKELNYKLPTEKVNKTHKIINIFDDYENYNIRKEKAINMVNGFFGNNKDKLIPLNSHNNHIVEYFKSKGLNVDYSFNDSSYNTYYTNYNNIYFNHSLYQVGTLFIINRAKTFIQAINPNNYIDKKLLKNSIVTHSRINHILDRKGYTFYNEGIANHLSLQYLSRKSNVKFNSIYCLSANNLKDILVMDTGIINSKKVICIDNDPTGYSIKEYAMSLGIKNFIEYPNKEKGYDISDCFVNDIDYLKHQLKEILTKNNK